MPSFSEIRRVVEAVLPPRPKSTKVQAGPNDAVSVIDGRIHINGQPFVPADDEGKKWTAEFRRLADHYRLHGKLP